MDEEIPAPKPPRELRPPPDYDRGPKLNEQVTGEGGTEERSHSGGASRAVTESIRLRKHRLNRPVFDPNYWNINYGHRLFPVPGLDPADPKPFIDKLMLWLWPGRQSANDQNRWWIHDKIFSERVVRLALEFNNTGLPRTVHADLSHEAAYPQFHQANDIDQPINPSYRCPCWIEVLGERWYNMSDADLVAQFHDPPSRNVAHNFLIHLLTRLITALTQAYLKDPRCTKINPNLPEHGRTSRFSKEILNVLNGMLQLRGSDMSKGINYRLKPADITLVAELCGLYREQIQGILRRRRSKRVLEAQTAQESSLVVQSSRTPEGISRDKMLYLDRALMRLKVQHPTINTTDIPPYLVSDFIKTFSSDSTPEILRAQFIEYAKYLINDKQQTSMSKGTRLRAEAVAYYNVLAKRKNLPPYDYTGKTSDVELCKLTTRHLDAILIERHLTVMKGQEGKPTDYEMREIAEFMQAMRDRDNVIRGDNASEEEVTQAEISEFLKRMFGPKSLQAQLQRILMDQETGAITPDQLKASLDLVNLNEVNALDPELMYQEMAQEQMRRALKHQRQGNVTQSACPWAASDAPLSQSSGEDASYGGSTPSEGTRSPGRTTGYTSGSSPRAGAPSPGKGDAGGGGGGRPSGNDGSGEAGGPGGGGGGSPPHGFAGASTGGHSGSGDPGSPGGGGDGGDPGGGRGGGDGNRTADSWDSFKADVAKHWPDMHQLLRRPSTVPALRDFVKENEPKRLRYIAT